jgi:Protein of unknown function (DUF2752)
MFAMQIAEAPKTRVDVGATQKPPGPLNALQDNTPDQPGLAPHSSGRYLRADQRKSRAILAFSFMALLAGAALLPFASGWPGPSVQTCVFKGATGLPCALCGGSRATQAALRGDFARAWYLNVAALPAIVIATSVTLLLCYEAISGNAVIAWSRFPRRMRPLLPLLLVVFCVYWIVHLADAVRRAKPELIDLRNPIARLICERFSDWKR